MAISDGSLADDTFWLNIGAEIIYNSEQKRKDSVDSLQKTIVWVFSVYSIISFASTILTNGLERNLEKCFWYFGLGIGCLIIGYFLSTIASFPTLNNFYPNSVESVKDGYNKMVDQFAWYFYSAVIISSIGSILYACAIFLLLTTPTIKVQVPKSLDKSISISKILNEQSNKYRIQINSLKNKWHYITLIHIDKANSKVDTILIDGANKSLGLRTSSEGNVYLDLPRLEINNNYQLCINRIDSIVGDENISIHKFKFPIK